MRRLDDLQLSGRKIYQDTERFCFGMDAVFLSGFARVQKGDLVIDLGSGNGILPILLEAKTKGRHFTGLELQEENVALAQESIALNQRQDRISMVCGDICRVEALFGKGGFDVVLSNPPYLAAEDGAHSPTDARSLARHELACRLSDVLSAAAYLLHEGGRCFFVYRTYRMAEMLRGMSEWGLEPKRLRLVYPRVDREPKLFLVEGLKGGRSGMRTEPPLIISELDGSYTKELREEYRF